MSVKIDFKKNGFFPQNNYILILEKTENKKSDKKVIAFYGFDRLVAGCLRIFDLE